MEYNKETICLINIDYSQWKLNFAPSLHRMRCSNERFEVGVSCFQKENGPIYHLETMKHPSLTESRLDQISFQWLLFLFDDPFSFIFINSRRRLISWTLLYIYLLHPLACFGQTIFRFLIQILISLLNYLHLKPIHINDILYLKPTPKRPISFHTYSNHKIVFFIFFGNTNHDDICGFLYSNHQIHIEMVFF